MTDIQRASLPNSLCGSDIIGAAKTGFWRSYTRLDGVQRMGLGRLLQYMDETPNFDCSQLQVLVLDEADRILDVEFEKEINAIISQLPKHRQTLLFSATQTKSVRDLAKLSLNDPEYQKNRHVIEFSEGTSQLKDIGISFKHQAAYAAMLTWVMGQRYMQTSKIMPAGIVAGISVLMTGFYLYKIAMGGNHIPAKT
ncbi:DEAD-box ATP-dependent RNA helicase 32 [Olea europaea subsp. europaea]|uniref:DEAD-box ATP-dependent RNA helicase 32 n=1 Tax=Olea europaea subsp. europaea TaxID=158383 RepID=A0A8S0U8F2_OLEEU|nr:DEAD-box ATP-dependent RNA helicase 32 [Olea europaea subsp. europaea]